MLKHLFASTCLLLAGCSAPSPLPTSTQAFWKDMEEASPVVVKGKLLVMGSHRHGGIHPLLTPLHGDAIVFKDPAGTTIKTISSTLAACAATTTPNNVLLTCANDAYAAHGNEVVLMTLDNTLNVVEERNLFAAPAGTVIDNTSLASDGTNWVLAYQNAPFSMFTGMGGHYTTSFMTSTDLKTWKPLGKNISGHYSAAPSLKYAEGWWYVLTTAQTTKSSRPLETVVTRTKDFRTFSKPQVLLKAPQGSVCACDADMVELNGLTAITYNVGDQEALGDVVLQVLEMPMGQLLRHYF